MNFERKIAKIIEKQLFLGPLILLYGPRQVGKTFLCKELLKKYPQEGLYLNCELEEHADKLNTKNSQKLAEVLGVGKRRLVVLDEAHMIPDIGSILKIIIDTFPDLQVIATGSSSFTLAQHTSEPLTGRSRQYTLLPMSLGEIAKEHEPTELDAMLESRLRFGSYPALIGQSETEAVERLESIAANYLYKDILRFEDIRKPKLVSDILKALSLQLGNEVSITEIATMLRTNHHTVERYIDILEQAYIVFRLYPLSTNPRKEIGKKYKIYFYDTGIRNSVIRNYNELALRNDVGALWENYYVSEMVKRAHNERRFVNRYFWRSYAGQEIDFIEEYGGQYHGYECKWRDRTYRPPRYFLETYPNALVSLVTKENYRDILLG